MFGRLVDKLRDAFDQLGAASSGPLRPNLGRFDRSEGSDARANIFPAEAYHMLSQRRLNRIARTWIPSSTRAKANDEHMQAEWKRLAEKDRTTKCRAVQLGGAIA